MDHVVGTIQQNTRMAVPLLDTPTLKCYSSRMVPDRFRDWVALSLLELESVTHLNVDQ